MAINSFRNSKIYTHAKVSILPRNARHLSQIKSTDVSLLKRPSEARLLSFPPSDLSFSLSLARVRNHTQTPLPAQTLSLQFPLLLLLLPMKTLTTQNLSSLTSKPQFQTLFY